MGETYTAQEIYDQYGVAIEQSFPVDASGEVPLIAVKPELNPQAPEVIYCSDAVRAALRRLEPGSYVTVFMQQAINQWENVGFFRVGDVSVNDALVARAIEETGRDDDHEQGPVTVLLYLERVEGL